MPLEVPPHAGNIQYLRIEADEARHLLSGLQTGR